MPTHKVFPESDEFPHDVLKREQSAQKSIFKENVKNAIAVGTSVLALVVSAGAAFGQNAGSRANNHQAYNILPAEEDWRFLVNPALRNDIWDRVKYIPLPKHAEDWYRAFFGVLADTGPGPMDRRRWSSNKKIHETDNRPGF